MWTAVTRATHRKFRVFFSETPFISSMSGTNCGATQGLKFCASVNAGPGVRRIHLRTSALQRDLQFSGRRPTKETKKKSRNLCRCWMLRLRNTCKACMGPDWFLFENLRVLRLLYQYFPATKKSTVQSNLLLFWISDVKRWSNREQSLCCSFILEVQQFSLWKVGAGGGGVTDRVATRGRGVQIHPWSSHSQRLWTAIAEDLYTVNTHV